MSLSMYRLSIPAFVRGFGVLSAYLDKADAHAQANGLEPEILMQARLSPDMLPLAGQVQRASDTSKNAIVRLAGIPAPSFPDTETTFAELRQRIGNTLDFFASVEPGQLEDSAAREVVLKFGKMQATLTGEEYLLTFVLPNFYFHLATAHGILRHQGVPIGKLDYLGPFG
ncbi:MAG TPA: DUF1993 domain-containing protein [Pseudoxanthomonas sp.]